MTQLIRLYFAADLREAKMMTDEVIGGKQFEFEIEDIERAKKIAAEFDEIGAIVEIEDV